MADLGIKKILAMFRGTAGVGDAASVDQMVAPHSDLLGNQWARLAISTSIAGLPADATGRAPSADGILPAAIFAQDCAVFPYGFNGTSWIRLLVESDSANGLAASANGLLGVVSRLQAVNQTSGLYDRLSCHGTDADGEAPVNAGALMSDVHSRLFNGATFDRMRGNVASTVLASAVRAATTASADQVNYNGLGLHIIFDITAVPGVDTVMLEIQAKDPASGKYYPLLTGAAEVAVATRIYRIFPGLVPVANATVDDVLPRDWRVNVTHSGAGNFTYSVGAQLVL